MPQPRNTTKLRTRLAPDKARIVDKLPGNYSYLGLIGLIYSTKIIYCARDPRDIAVNLTFRFHSHHPYAHDLGDLGWTIAQHGRLMDHWRAVLPDAILTVKLFNWVEDFDGTLARVLDHLDLPPDRTAPASMKATAVCAPSATRECASR